MEDIHRGEAQPLESPVNSDASDVDSDYEELQGDIAKYDETVRQFLEAHRGRDEANTTRAGPSLSRGTPRGRSRGPRKAAKLRGDITARLSKVNQAFLAGDYPRALDLASEVIRINAEVYQAWTALASIFGEMGETDKSLSAMVYAAHLRPKDVGGWLRGASFALDNIDQDETENLHTARLCYSAAIRADPHNLEARLGKATVCHRQGHFAAAISEYKTVLNQHPHDLDIVRKLAEACIDSRQSGPAAKAASAAYRRYFDIEIQSGSRDMINSLWHDVGIYVELSANDGSYRGTISELKSLARWLVGRQHEVYWDDWQADDREWDADDTRRASVPSFRAEESDPALYGLSLPLELRARLAIYRMRLEEEEEALKHLSWIDPAEDVTRDFTIELPFLAYDVASELARRKRLEPASQYFELLREVAPEPDAAVLLQLGRCYLESGRQSAAEECFLGAIEADPDGIESRIELANMYEKAEEDEEALILAAEAMALRGAQDDSGQDMSQKKSKTVRSGQPRRQSTKSGGDPTQRNAAIRARRSVIPRRHRPKRLGAPDQRRKEEKAHALKLSRQYQAVCELKQRISDGERDLVHTWMQSSRELLEDFQSLKQFYSWDKYLEYLGSRSSFHPIAQGDRGHELFQMYERLTRSLVPQNASAEDVGDAASSRDHQGISFDDWLDVFVDFSIGLAVLNNREEAYQVCEIVRDSTVFQSSHHNFRIHIAWSVCAILTSDEEKCVSISRHLMKEGATSDSARMFALLSTLCQSPITWYTSGPAQKFILRQIRAIDTTHFNSSRDQLTSGGADPNTTGTGDVQLDVCLLMLYGHILFTSTSYTYALGYFLRARALDESNAMVNLSLGLAYVHYALKRQSVNRQYLILQGLSFMSRYASREIAASGNDDRVKAETHFNIGRLYHLLGITSLALKHYAQQETATQSQKDDIGVMSATNQVLALLASDEAELALCKLKQEVIL